MREKIKNRNVYPDTFGLTCSRMGEERYFFNISYQVLKYVRTYFLNEKLELRKLTF
jgi:hypothetical protein